MLAVFGELLSSRQRTCLEAHYREGRSLAAIARDLGISRQAVLDAVSHAESRLMRLADCLEKAGVSLHRAEGSNPDAQGVLSLLQDLRVRIAHEGVIYSTRWIVDSLDRAIDQLQSKHPDGASR